MPEDGTAIPGLLLNGVEAVMISRPPFNIPEVPNPATALPTINIVEETARPHNREPNSKSTRKAKNVY